MPADWAPDVLDALLGAGADPQDLALNLRGARLDGATLHFANLSGSFEGARLGGFDFGYARVSGSADAWTELPADQSCEVTDSPWAGKQITCVR